MLANLYYLAFLLSISLHQVLSLCLHIQKHSVCFFPLHSFFKFKGKRLFTSISSIIITSIQQTQGLLSVDNCGVSVKQVRALVGAARAELHQAHDEANIAVKYEDLAQPLQTTSKNKRL